MKISESTVEMLSKQVNAEFYASYLYFSMSIWADRENLPGLAKWMELQAKEELEHAERLHKYITERGGSTILAPIDLPPGEFASALEVMEAAYEHELMVTDNFTRMTATALEEQDFATVSALRWFIDEQVEEEAQTSHWVDRLRLAGERKGALLMIDNQLAQRQEA
ncbi:MAG: ferritin [Bacillota bacterium]|nr:ferritin [Bacillota bacterium]